MAYFEYVAKDLKGTYKRGRIKAASEDEVWKELRLLGLFPVKIRQQRSRRRKRPLKAGQLASFSGSIASMTQMGIPLAQAMKLLCSQEKKADIKELYTSVYSMLLQGMELSDAMEAQGGIFPPLIIGMFRAGEIQGDLGKTAQNAASFYEKEDYFQKKMGTAVTYPLFLLAMIAGVLILLFTQILPEFFGIFQAVESLPSSTRFLMAVSRMMTDSLIEMVLIFAAGAAVISWILSFPAVKEAKDKAVFYLPLVGNQFRIVITARFAETLRSLYMAGVSLPEALELSAEISGNEYIKKCFTRIKEEIQNGIPLSEAVAEIKELNHQLAAGLYIGEEADAIDSMLDQTARTFGNRAETAAQRILALVEPVLILLMAVIIGYIMISVMVPVYQYYQTMG